MCHGGEVQFAQVDIAEQALPLFAGFRRDVVGMALVFALEMSGALRHMDIDPLLVIVKVDSECWFRHMSTFLGDVGAGII